MIRILQIDGGGVRGIIPATILSHIESETGVPSHDLFDLIVGTSTGSIIGGLLAAGISAEKIRELYVTRAGEMFTRIPWYKRWWGLAGPKYDRKPVQSLIEKYIQDRTLSGVKTDFMSTTFNGCSGRTHFQMSWNDYHKTLKLIDVISWSALSAVHYFGPIPVKDYVYDLVYQRSRPGTTSGAVFFDGGQGRNNCALGKTITTAFLNGWVDDGKQQVHILSLGTGAPKLFVPYRQANSKGKVKRIKDYINQSRGEAVHDQLHKARSLERVFKNLHIHRLDPIITKEHDTLDNIDAIASYKSYGEELRKDVPGIFLNL